jgi:hypothetical protein
MNNQSQSHARAMPVARLAELKPSVSTVAAHKYLVDATGHKRWRFSDASGVCGTPLPVRLRAEFQFDGRINDRAKKTL